MREHNFRAKLEEGEGYEGLLDIFFGQTFQITRADDWQRYGIDRFFQSGKWNWAVEYKADSRAAQTGNVFIETVSVDTNGDKQGTPGWAKTSQAHLLVYYIPPAGRIFFTQMARIKALVSKWERAYELVPARNDAGYYTWGLKVPISEFKKHCVELTV